MPTNRKLQVLERLYTHRIVNKQRYYGIKLEDSETNWTTFLKLTIKTKISDPQK